MVAIIVEVIKMYSIIMIIIVLNIIIDNGPMGNDTLRKISYVITLI